MQSRLGCVSLCPLAGPLWGTSATNAYVATYIFAFLTSGTFLVTFLALILYRRAVQNKEREWGGGGSDSSGGEAVAVRLAPWGGTLCRNGGLSHVHVAAFSGLRGSVGMHRHACTQLLLGRFLLRCAVTMDDLEARLRAPSAQMTSIAGAPASPRAAGGLGTSRSEGAWRTTSV